MSEVKLSKRAEQVWAWCHSSESWNPDWIPEGARNDKILCLHQATVALQLGCSRWTIGRAIKRLKEAGLLLEIGRDKQSRCKTYALQVPSPLGGEGFGVRFPELDPGSVAGVTEAGDDKIPPNPPLSKGGEIQLQNYRRTFELNFIHWPDWEKHYAAVTWELKDVECIHKLFRQTFDKLYELRAKAQANPCSKPQHNESLHPA